MKFTLDHGLSAIRHEGMVPVMSVPQSVLVDAARWRAIVASDYFKDKDAIRDFADALIAKGVVI